VGFEELMEFFLGNFLSQIAYQEIGVSVKLLVNLLKTNAEEFAISKLFMASAAFSASSFTAKDTKP